MLSFKSLWFSMTLVALCSVVYSQAKIESAYQRALEFINKILMELSKNKYVVNDLYNIENEIIRRLKEQETRIYWYSRQGRNLDLDLIKGV